MSDLTVFPADLAEMSVNHNWPTCHPPSWLKLTPTSIT